MNIALEQLLPAEQETKLFEIYLYNFEELHKLNNWKENYFSAFTNINYFFLFGEMNFTSDIYPLRSTVL